MMSGPGTRNKGKHLIQTKLSFTTTPTAKKPGADSDTSDTNCGKGTKRKTDVDEDMDPDMRSKMLEAAEKRQKLHKEAQEKDSTKVDVSNIDKKNPQENDDSKKLVEEAVASTSANVGASPAGDTLQYDMSDSQDLFATTDSETNMNDSQQSNVDAEESDEDPSLNRKPSTWDASRPWKGKPLDKLNTAPACLSPSLRLEISGSHTICFKLPYKYSKTALPIPYPSSFHDQWDAHHVRMPCSNENQYPVSGEGSSMRLARRWDLITQALKSPITSPLELEEAILTYNQRYVNKWSFTVLHHFLNKHIKPEDRQHFFECVLPFMVKLALKLPFLCTKPIPLLKKDKAQKISLSQQQIACLLANAFFCTFPRRNSRARSSEFCSYPSINFNSLFQGHPIPRKLEKLTCIIHYFKRVCYDVPKGVVTYSRQVLPKSYHWRQTEETLMELHVSSAGTIEDNGIGMLQVDFANKYLGGGVLNTGCVQEEIRFMICPEMIISCLFTEVLGETESLVMTGCEQFSEYEGYADTFRWKNDFQDKTERDSAGRLCCEVVAIDALVFRNNYNRQFQTASLMRELNKAYCGFMSSEKEVHRAAVCTGNWGCGAFGGDKQLKSLIQLMAASAAKRDLCYFTFEDENLTKNLHRVYETLRNEEKTLREILVLMEKYNKEVVSGSWGRPKITLFEFIHAKLDGFTDSQDFPAGSGVDIDEDSNEAIMYGSAVDGSPDYKESTP